MFRRHIIYFFIAFVVPIPIFSQVPSETDINSSISKGLEFLAGQQNEDGSWGIFHTVEDPDGKQKLASERVALTGFALTKLCERAYELQFDSPYEPDYIYSEHVIRGFEFLLNLADTYGEGKGIFGSSGAGRSSRRYRTMSRPVPSESHIYRCRLRPDLPLSHGRPNRSSEDSRRSRRRA